MLCPTGHERRERENKREQVLAGGRKRGYTGTAETLLESANQSLDILVYQRENTYIRYACKQTQQRRATVAAPVHVCI